jgi:hypothetical protein
VDGSGRPFEVRPDPSNDPMEVVENIANIFREAVSDEPRLASYNWIAGADPRGWPTGGHIHFGIMQPNGRFMVEPPKACARLDNHLGAILALIEGPEGSLRRSHNYGLPGDYRIQQWGFEYRTPASWLTSPYVAAACLCLAKAIVWESVNNDKFAWRDHLLKPSETYDPYTPGGPTSNAIRTSNLAPIRDHFPSIWEDITKLTLYQDLKIQIDMLHFLVANKLQWHPRKGMQQAWGINNALLPMPFSLDMDSIWLRNQGDNHG